MSEFQEVFYTKIHATPLGPYVLVSSSRGVVCVEPEESMAGMVALYERSGIAVRPGNGFNAQAARELDAYFKGALRRFETPLDLRGTPFQRKVWRLLQEIPYGETRSYGDIAAAMEKRSSARAVGQANGKNPVSIIVPCHRVIGSSGRLVGYGGGLQRKRALLELEARVLRGQSPA